MLKVLLALLGLAMIISADDTARNDFMRAMDEVTQKKSLQVFQNKLLEHAVPRARSLADNAYADDDYSLDLSQYAMKYVGCQNIKLFSDDLAQDEDSETVLGLNRFVVFRMCLADKCSTYNKYGCQDSFGEYVIEMEMYLEIMSEYHHQKYLEYCATCIECMNPPDDLDDDYVYQVYNNTDDAYIDESNETVSWSAENDCEYYSACLNYKQACKTYNTNGDDSVYNNLLGCTQFVVGNDVGYLGPHCGEDGMSITMGIYKDDECTEYAGNQVDLGYSSGAAMDDSWLSFFYNPTCISCTNTQTFALYNDTDDGQGVYEMCEVLYEASGKCNRYMNEQNIEETYNSEIQADDELNVCNFVDSLMENNYDETGEIWLKSASFDIANWQSLQEYQKEVSRMTPVQMFFLIASLFLMLGLFIYAVYLYSKIRTYLGSKNRYPTYRSYTIDRDQSGITENRSDNFGAYA